MTARELQLKDQGIALTGFGAPRRPAPELARQQCDGCAIWCHGDCQGTCDTQCDSECYDQCLNDNDVVASYVAHPKALLSSSGVSRMLASERVDNM